MKLFQTQAKQIGLGCVQNLPVIALIFGIVVLSIGVFLGLRWDLAFGFIALNVTLISLMMYALNILPQYKYNNSHIVDTIIMSAYYSSLGILLGMAGITILPLRWGIDGALKGALSGVVVGVGIQSIFGLIGAIYGAFYGRFGQAVNETLLGGALGAVILFFTASFFYDWDSPASLSVPWIIIGAIIGASTVIAVKIIKIRPIKDKYIGFLVWLGAEPPSAYSVKKRESKKGKGTGQISMSKGNRRSEMIPEEDLPEWLKPS